MAKTLTRDQLNGILKSLPDGASKEAAVGNLIKAGYSFEGFTGAKQSQTPAPKETEPAKLFGMPIVNPQAEVLKGQIKDLGKSALGMARVGQGFLQGVTGIKPVGGQEQFQQTIEQKREALNPQGTLQGVGAVTSQIGQFLAPIGGTKIALAERAGKAITGGGKVASVLRGALRAGAAGTQEALDAAVRAYATTGGDKGAAVTAAATAGPLASAFEAITPVLKTVAPRLAVNLEKMNLRLTPTQQRNLGSKVDDAANFIVRNKITGSPEQRLAKIDDIYSQTEDTLQNFLNSTAKDRTISKQELLAEIDGLKKNFAGDRDVFAIESQIDEFKNLINARYPDNIPVNQLNELKRSTWKNAFNSAGTKVRDDVEFALGDRLKTNIEKATDGLTVDGKPIGEFNREYQTLINAKNLIKASQGRNQIGFFGRLLSTALGSQIGNVVGGPVGSAIGTALGDVTAQATLGTPTRSGIASVLGGLDIGSGRSLLPRGAAAVTTQIQQMLGR